MLKPDLSLDMGTLNCPHLINNAAGWREIKNYEYVGFGSQYLSAHNPNVLVVVLKAKSMPFSLTESDPYTLTPQD